MIFWVIIITLVLGVSLILAKKSLRSYQEAPKKHFAYGLYLIRNPLYFNEATLKKIHDLCLPDQHIISVEKLFKGMEVALCLYLPKNIVNQLEELNLLELEDYINKEYLNTSFTFQITQKLSQKPLFTDPQFLKDLDIEDQQFFWQVVVLPHKGDSFQATLRGMLIEKDPTKKIGTIKILERKITDQTGLVPQTKGKTQSSLFEWFKKRQLVPKEVKSFPLTSPEILSLVS